MHRACALACLLAAAPASAAALELDFVVVGDAGNPADTTGLGSVAYDFAISRYEISNAEYVAFLNQVATESDPYDLYDPQMPIDFPLVPVGFERAYEVEPGAGDLPVVFVSLYDAMRFANWLHNGQPHGLQGPATTETGAYTITQEGIAAADIVRESDARFFVPTEDEWYKAAYWDASFETFIAYPAGDSRPITCAPPTDAPNHANCSSGVLTPRGSYPNSSSPIFTYDQGGNAFEWTESIDGINRYLRGGDFFSHSAALTSSESRNISPPHVATGYYGFRIARAVPEPAGGSLGLAAAVTLAALRGAHRVCS